MHHRLVTGCIVPYEYDHGVRMLLLEFAQKDMRGSAVKTVDGGEMKTLPGERRHCGEKIAVVERLLVVAYRAHPNLRPAPAEV